MTVIGLTGYARSGKDTVADYLVEEHGFQKIGFAEPLKALALELDPVIWHRSGAQMSLRMAVDMRGWEQTKEETNVRDYLVRLGDGARRIVHEDVWVDAVRETILENPGQDFVISDVRYGNEADMIREESDGKVWRIWRTGVEAANEVERSVVGIASDYAFVNDGTKEDLFAKVEEVLDSWPRFNPSGPWFDYPHGPSKLMGYVMTTSEILADTDWIRRAVSDEANGSERL